MAVGLGVAVGAAVGVAVGLGVALGAADSDGAADSLGAALGDGAAASTSVTGTVMSVTRAPSAIAGTPSRPSQVVAPSTMPALTTYVEAGSMTPGSTWIVNAIGSAGDGTTSRATSVPVSWLTSVAIATASADSGVVSVRVIVPVTSPVAVAATGATGTVTSADRSAGDDRDRLEALEGRGAVDDGRVQRVAVGRVDRRVVIGDRELGRQGRAVDPLLADDDARVGARLLVDERHHEDGVARQGGRVLRGHRCP